MQRAKTFGFALGLLLFASHPGQGVVPVTDTAAITASQIQHEVELAKLIAMIAQLQAAKEWLGNAADIIDLAGIDEVYFSLDLEGVGLSRLEIALSTTSLDAVLYDGGALYTPVGDIFLSRDGEVVVRPDVFKPEGAIFNAVLDHDRVYDDVMGRRQMLRLGREQTMAQLQVATTHAEIQKAPADLLAQQGELEAADRELTFATQKAQLLDLQNRADTSRQEKAMQQEQAQEFTERLRSFSQLLRPPQFLNR